MLRWESMNEQEIKIVNMFIVYVVQFVSLKLFLKTKLKKKGN